MNRTPAQQWSALSALYEEADGLGARELGGFLARLEAEGNELLPQLRRMLDARDHMETDDFLSTMPRLSTEAQAATSWSAGRRVGPYKLVRPLGEGGMAEVWLAERDDGAFKRQVAIKLPYPKPGRETFAVRFDRERDILATLRHPNIAGLFDAGVTAEGQAWLALEYVEGQPISVFCDERRLSVRERVQLFRQVLLAVQHAHANLVIHRDLKPANILVTPQGEVRLLDFGIAKLLESEGDAVDETELTRQAGRSMTPRYASPEQLMGVPLTTACDVYSLGVVFYELVSGERPYELKVDSPAQLEYAILEAEPRAPSRRALGEAIAAARGTTVKGLRKMLAPEMDAIALRCLAKKPSARYSSVDAILADVDRWLAGDAVLARAPTAWYRVRKFTSKHVVAVSLGAASIVALIGITAVAVTLGLRAREESARASASRDFMIGLFQRADQEKFRGADITARELLETGRKDLNVRLAGQPQLQAEMLYEIGKIQVEMGEYVKADSTFEEAARLYADLDMVREEGFARASHADNALRMGDPKRAQALLQQARSRAGNAPHDELAAYIELIQGWISGINFEGEAAKSAFATSLRLSSRTVGPTHDRAIEAMRGLVYAEKQLRQFDEALKHLDELGALMRSKPGIRPSVLVGLDMDRADILQHAGRFAENARHTAIVVPRCETLLGGNSESCRRLFLSSLQARMRSHVVPLDQSELARLEAIIADATSPAVQAEALQTSLRWESLLGESPKQQMLFDKVAALAHTEGSGSLNPAIKARACLLLAESRLVRRDFSGADRLIDRVSDIWGRAGSGPMPAVLDAGSKALRTVSLLQQGRFEEALAQASAARQALTGILGKDHALAMIYSLNEASALEQLGRYGEALEVVRQAKPILERALDADSTTLKKLSAMHARLRAALDGTKQAALPQRSPTDFFT